MPPGKDDPLASETRPAIDDSLTTPDDLSIDALSQDAYDDDSGDIFAKARNFQIVKQAKAFGLYPFFRALENNEGTEVVIDGERKIMLGSNNYLGLTRHPRVVKAARDAVETYGTSMTGSRLLNGTSKLHERLEELLADFFGYEACLTFTTGYQANIGTISALANRRAVVVIDKDDHGSIYDGCKLSDGEMVRFRHNDVDHLEQVLSEIKPSTPTLVIVDGVFSMGGDIAPLPGIVQACQRYGARLLVDDAHAVGVLGKGGRGTGSHFGLEKEVDLQFGTFSKSLASIGGFICGPADVITWIQHFARSGLFSASMAPSAVVAATTALEVLIDEPELVDKLNANAKLLRDGLRNAGFDIGKSETPVVPIVVGDEVKMIGFWKALLAAGVYTNAVVTPAVARGAGILRTSCMATHTPEQIIHAVGLMAELGVKHKIIA
ncbi:MAG TPA: pyridoxal phosphate-dependent aminotransferase family protein [Dehalococcoidia bacterium]|nr:pyridoxal phosphate-dependent aminotransferase family protein [Dehalococcoidia bacterium]